jgi:hypothetical protein
MPAGKEQARSPSENMNPWSGAGYGRWHCLEGGSPWPDVIADPGFMRPAAVQITELPKTTTARSRKPSSAPGSGKDTTAGSVSALDQFPEALNSVRDRRNTKA